MLELVLGEVAQVITKGQKVLPARAQALGYRFEYPDLAGALRALVAKPKAPPRPEPIPAASGAVRPIIEGPVVAGRAGPAFPWMITSTDETDPPRR